MIYNTGVTSGAGTVYPFGAPEFTSGFSWVRVIRSLVFCVVYCRLLFVHCSLCCLFIFDLRLLITPYVKTVYQIWTNSAAMSLKGITQVVSY